LAQRWKLTRQGATVQRVEADLKKVFPIESWNQLHLRIIFYGREHCSARGCDGHTCEICLHLNGPSKVKAKSKSVKRVAKRVRR
jgi:endonuclease-3